MVAESKQQQTTTQKISSLSSSLQYDSKRDNKRKAMELDNSSVSFQFNKVTAKKKGNAGGKHKAQLTAQHLTNSPAPLITPQHGDFVEVDFSSNSSVYVLYAREDSECPLLRTSMTAAIKEQEILLTILLMLCPKELGNKTTMLVGDMHHLGLDPWIKDKLGPSF